MANKMNEIINLDNIQNLDKEKKEDEVVIEDEDYYDDYDIFAEYIAEFLNMFEYTLETNDTVPDTKQIGAGTEIVTASDQQMRIFKDEQIMRTLYVVARNTDLMSTFSQEKYDGMLHVSFATYIIQYFHDKEMKNNQLEFLGMGNIDNLPLLQDKDFVNMTQDFVKKQSNYFQKLIADN